jgi:hypothetical protein
VAIAHKERLSRTFVAHPTAKTASGKRSHCFAPYPLVNFVRSLLAPIAREIDIGIRYDFVIEPIQISPRAKRCAMKEFLLPSRLACKMEQR